MDKNLNVFIELMKHQKFVIIRYYGEFQLESEINI